MAPRDGRKSSNPAYDAPNGSLKLSVMIPKLLHRKPSDARTEMPRPLTDAMKASHAKGRLNLSPTPTRNSPTPNFDTSLRSDVSQVPTSGEDFSVFCEHNLSTSSSIRSTIAATEAELRTLVDEFQTLEARTLRRIQKQKAHRLPTNTPATVDILLEGREWREHRLVPSLTPSSPSLLDSASHRHLFASPSTDSPTSDGTSVRSASSHNTNLSRARSISSLSKISHSGPVSTGSFLRSPAKKHSTPRKTSMSSTTSSLISSHHSHSHDLSLRPPCLQAFNNSNNLSTPQLSRSKSLLGLKKLKGSSPMFSQKTFISSVCASSEEGPLGYGGSSGCVGRVNEIDPELVDVRRRKEQLVARYNARLEFLRAKLRSAELHEKLLKR